MASSSYVMVTLPDLKLRMGLFFCVFGIAFAQLQPITFYDSRCPGALVTIKKSISLAVSKDRRMGASLLRLHFHDCFVQGCDASVLLKDTVNFTGEQNAFPNMNSLRGFDVIDNIKYKLETLCPGVFSCADILAVSAKESVVALSGLGWQVSLGRRDSTTASLRGANSDLPGPFLDLGGLVSGFAKKGFTAQEMVALSGAHTIGKGRCRFFKTRIYNESNIDPSFAKSLKGNCPTTGGDDNFSSLDNFTSVDLFDSGYYKSVVNKKGLFHSDQQLFNGGFTKFQVLKYTTNSTLFQNDFARAMEKMGKLSPLTGTKGQIRKQCSRVN
ncbi:unnamed protein product [Lupinus luteus]|uniref:Peroxidase n=1 Tax=Lupinus luteus TaxID=3873 RepID=A0AAV1XTR1_LUPLU